MECIIFLFNENAHARVPININHATTSNRSYCVLTIRQDLHVNHLVRFYSTGEVDTFIFTASHKWHLPQKDQLVVSKYRKTATGYKPKGPYPFSSFFLVSSFSVVEVEPSTFTQNYTSLVLHIWRQTMPRHRLHLSL